MDGIECLFNDIDLLAKKSASVDIREYIPYIDMKEVHSNDSSEQGAYYCAIKKDVCPTFNLAFPVLFIHQLYQNEEWDKKTEIIVDSDISWESVLKDYWIPDYSVSRNSEVIKYKFVDKIDFWFQIADKIVDRVFRSKPLCIIRYGDINAWNFLDYIIETETEFIDFQSWTTA